MQHSNKINRSGRFIMDSANTMSVKLNAIYRYGLSLTAVLLLSACGVAPVKPEPGAEPTPIEEVTPVSENLAEGKEKEYLPLNAQLTYQILTAEIAQQRGDILSAAELYSRASMQVDSPSVARRAAQLANLTRDPKRIDASLKRWAEVDPNDADIYMLQAPFLMIQGQYDEVVKAMNKAIELAPERSALFLTRSTDNLSKIVQAEPALNILRQLTPFQQQETEALFQYARLAAYFDHNQESLSVVEKILQLDPSHERSLILKAKTLQKLKQPEQALASLQQAVKNKDASKSLRFTYAQLLGENNKIEESQRVFEQLYTDFPDDQDIVFALGLLALEQQQNDKAKQFFNRLIVLGDRTRVAAYFMGLTEKQSGNPEAAKSWFAAVPENSPRFEAAQTHFINILAESGQIDMARNHIQSLRQANPERAVQYYLFEAGFLNENGLHQPALDMFDTALQEYPGNIDLLYGRAMAAEPLNKLDILEQDLRTILEVEPNNAAALNALGYTLTDRTNRHEEALLLISKALEIQPNDPFYLDSLGWVYYRLGKLEQAEHYLRKAVDLQDDAEFSAHLGEVLWQQGQHDDAKAVWNAALEMNTDNTLLRETMQRFGL